MGMEEVRARLGLDIKPFEAALAQSGKSVSEFGKRVGKDFGAKDAGKALATALGLNLDKIGESFARLYTGVTKEAEEAYKAIAELSEKNTEDQKAQNRARLNDEAKLNQLLIDRAGILKNATSTQQEGPGLFASIIKTLAGGQYSFGGAIAPFFQKSASQIESNDADTARALKLKDAETDKARLIANAKEIADVQKRVDDKTRSNTEKERAIEEDKLSVGQKAFALMDDLDALEAESVKMNKTSLEYTEQQTRILDKKKQIQDQLNKLGAEEAARLKKEKEDEQKIKDLKKDRVQAVADVGEAQKNLDNANMDPSRLTIDELSKLDKFDPRTSTQAAGLIGQAQDIKGLEGKGEEARSFGRMEDAKGFFDQADSAKKALVDSGAVKSTENPAKAQVEELQKANAKLETINTALAGKFANQ